MSKLNDFLLKPAPVEIALLRESFNRSKRMYDFLHKLALEAVEISDEADSVPEQGLISRKNARKYLSAMLSVGRSLQADAEIKTEDMQNVKSMLLDLTSYYQRKIRASSALGDAERENLRSAPTNINSDAHAFVGEYPELRPFNEARRRAGNALEFLSGDGSRNGKLLRATHKVYEEIIAMEKGPQPPSRFM